MFDKYYHDMFSIVKWKKRDHKSTFLWQYFIVKNSYFYLLLEIQKIIIECWLVASRASQNHNGMGAKNPGKKSVSLLDNAPN